MVSLALAIATNGIVYGLVDVVLHPFGFPQPDRLVSVGSTFPRLGSDENFIEAHAIQDVESLQHTRTLQHVAAFDLGNRAVSDGTHAERVFTGLLVDDLFPVLGLPPAVGRGFTRAELAPNGPPVAIISYRLWQSLYNGAPDVIGKTIRMNSEPRQIVGVIPDGPQLLGTDLWIPWAGDPARTPRSYRPFTVLGRIAPGATLADANRELATIASSTAAQVIPRSPSTPGGACTPCRGTRR